MSQAMKMNNFQKIAFFCVLSLIGLIFVGAVVRVTGAGMGCPDWPKCWGKYIPPSSIEGIDVDKLVTNEAFIREYRSVAGEDAVLTADALREMFNPRHTWTEYLNRLSSSPLAFGSIALLAYAQLFLRKRKKLLIGAYGAVFLVALNAVIGMLVVKTGLHEGVITLHMILAIMLLCLLVFLVWRGAESPKGLEFTNGKQKLVFGLGLGLFILIVVEGVMGSQVRELTDALLKSHKNEARSEWSAELEQAAVYLVHRSFSWVIVAGGLVFFWFNWTATKRRFTWIEGSVVGIIIAQMILGLVLAQVGVLPVVQVLHIGLSSILVSCLFYWLLCAGRKQSS